MAHLLLSDHEDRWSQPQHLMIFRCVAERVRQQPLHLGCCIGWSPRRMGWASLKLYRIVLWRAFIFWIAVLSVFFYVLFDFGVPACVPLRFFVLCFFAFFAFSQLAFAAGVGTASAGKRPSSREDSKLGGGLHCWRDNPAIFMLHQYTLSHSR